MASARKHPSDRALQMDRKRKEDERFTYRVLITFAVTAALFFFALNLSRQAETLSGQSYLDLMNAVTLWTLAAAGTLAAAALVSRFCLRRRALTVCLAYAAVVAGVALAAAQFIRYLSDHQLPLAVILAGLALLYLLYYIYPRAFMLLAVISSGGALGFWLMRRVLYSGSYGWVHPHRVWPGRATLPVIAFALAILLTSAALLLLRARKGRAGRLTVLPPDTQYRGLLATCGLLAAGLLATAAFGWMAAWVAMIACFAYLFIAAIYYTSKLM
ncbi:MAG: hypothetical protein FWG93_00875 [Oscillospiraceae bacterium]|nr:hypothetical protein [Oscillospiraceae bacterium]